MRRTVTRPRGGQPRPQQPPAVPSSPAGWLDDGGPRRLLERIPIGVPIGAAAAALGLGAGAHVGLVPDALAWGVGGPLFLGAEMFGLYALIAWRHARRARRARRDTEE